MRKVWMTGLMVLVAGSALAQVTISKSTVRTAQVVQASGTVTLPADTVTPAMAGKLVENYVNGLKTFQASFTQRTTGEAFTQEGMFYLDKGTGPGKFLWNYQSPNKQRLIATGSALYFVDDESGGAVTQLPVKAGLSRLFTGQMLSLAREGLKVTGATTRGNELEVRMAVANAKDDSSGVKQISLFFQRSPMQLVRADVLDAVDATTTVTFSNIRTGMPLDGKMFAFTPRNQR
jgi:outer membrane lipoprotein-sorting protein